MTTTPAEFTIIFTRVCMNTRIYENILVSKDPNTEETEYQKTKTWYNWTRTGTCIFRTMWWLLMNWLRW
jgi:hypothetical protein